MILPPEIHLISLDEVDSTNAEVRRRAEAGAPEGTLISARSQTAGRGRRGRRWESPEGNLYMSLLLRPAQPIDEAARLSFVAAISLGDVLVAAAPRRVKITHKWPNDIMANGRKCMGMLLESSAGAGGRLEWLVLGIGVNLVAHPENTSWPATNLAEEGVRNLTPAVVMRRFVHRFFAWRGVWQAQGFAPVREAWLARAQGRGEEIEVRTGSEVLTGIFDDIAADGALLLRQKDGTRRITAGDIFPAGA